MARISDFSAIREDIKICKNCLKDTVNLIQQFMWTASGKLKKTPKYPKQKLHIQKFSKTVADFTNLEFVKKSRKMSKKTSDDGRAPRGYDVNRSLGRPHWNDESCPTTVIAQHGSIRRSEQVGSVRRWWRSPSRTPERCIHWRFRPHH